MSHNTRRKDLFSSMSHAIAMLSVHTSPLVLPGSAQDAGGMNVYIRELARELGRSHCTVDIFTRRTQAAQPEIVQLAPRVRVIHIEAGPVAPIHKHDLYQYLPAFARQVEDLPDTNAGPITFCTATTGSPAWPVSSLPAAGACLILRCSTPWPISNNWPIRRRPNRLCAWKWNAS